MGEAFIMGGGGGGNATVQHITATNAASNTFTLTNPKRNNCLVFGRIYSNDAHYNFVGTYSYSYFRDHALYGTKYSVNHLERQASGYEASSFTSELGISFTRNAGSITITLNSSHPFTYLLEDDWDVNTDTTIVTRKRTNTIDIYVVDYD